MARQTLVPKKRKKKRGPPATGQGTQIQVRLHADLLKPLDRWIADQPAPKPSRPDAVRKALADWLMGLSLLPGELAADDQLSKSANMAGKTVDALADTSASLEDRALRKRRLVKGPKELRHARKDQTRRS